VCVCVCVCVCVMQLACDRRGGACMNLDLYVMERELSDGELT
jgi:hypothetical protein